MKLLALNIGIDIQNELKKYGNMLRQFVNKDLPE